MNTSVSSTRVEVSGQRDFHRYVASTFCATIAIMIQSVAVAWQVYDLTRNPLALGYVGLFQFLPLAIFTLPAGALADRLDRRAMLAATYVVQAVCAGVFVAMAIETPHVIWPFYALLTLFGTARAFAAPASQSLLPRLVSEERFPRAVALTSSTRQTGVIVGPALGGAIYLLGPAIAYGACLLFFIAVAVLVATLHTRTFTGPRPVGSTRFEHITAGIAYVLRKPVILGAISLDLFAVLLGGRDRTPTDLRSRHPVRRPNRPGLIAQRSCARRRHARADASAPTAWRKRRNDDVCLRCELWAGHDRIRRLA